MIRCKEIVRGLVLGRKRFNLITDSLAYILPFWCYTCMYLIGGFTVRFRRKYLDSVLKFS